MIDSDFQIMGGVSGYTGGAVFRLTNGQVWQQSRHLYRYKYSYRPRVRIFEQGGSYHLQIDGMEEAVVVMRARILEEGAIVSSFDGFSGSSRFEFQNGREWIQAEYKYAYHYAHRPKAIVIEGVNGTEIHVDGMSETVRVRRA
jgi:hypothetical protein